MKTTIIYDNTSLRKDLQADWGFSALVEANGERILFDTGADGFILLSNMQNLQIDPRAIDDVFISHADYDHVGGVYDFLRYNSNVRVWLPHSYNAVINAKETLSIRNPLKMYEGIYSTGELEEIEQSMCVETEKGIVIITGCSHPRMENIIEAASKFGRVYGIIGGLHGNPPETLEKFNLICATHCTMYREKIKLIYPDKYIEGGAGKVIEIGNV